MYWGTCQGSFSRHSSLQMVVEYIHISPRVSLHTIWNQGDGAGLHKKRLYREPPRLPPSQSHPFFPPQPALAVPYTAHRDKLWPSALQNLHWLGFAAFDSQEIVCLKHSSTTCYSENYSLWGAAASSLCLTVFTLLVTISFLLIPKSSYQSPPSGSTHLLASHSTS